jgi:hypothetical protein
MTDLPTLPAVDYTNKDFASLRQAMLDLASWRLPEWTDRSPGDLGMVLVDLFAYVGDVVLYYQDRIASEAFLPTAAERRSVQHLLRLIGYELAAPLPASTELDLFFERPKPNDPRIVRIRPGTGFTTKPDTSGERPTAALRFEYLGSVDVEIDLDSADVVAQPDDTLRYRGLPVFHAESQPVETVGTSTGEASQSFPLRGNPVLDNTLVVEVEQGSGFVRWDRRRNLLYDVDPGDGRLRPSGREDRHYTVERDELGQASVVFGDGNFGLRPPADRSIRARYAVGGGTIANVPPGAISVVASGAPRSLKAVTNPRAAVGGTDAESIDHARRFGPLAFRSGDRAVTLRDYVALAHQAGGVAKVRAHTTGWNRVDLVVVPEGDRVTAVSDGLRQRLLEFFEDRKMLGTSVRIVDAAEVPVDIRVEVLPEHHFDPEAVRGRARTAVAGLLAFDRVELGRSIYLSKVYEAVEALDGVAAAVVTRFRRHQLHLPHVFVKHKKLLEAKFANISDAVERTYLGEVTIEGRIEVGDLEIAVPGEIVVELRYDAP